MSTGSPSSGVDRISVFLTNRPLASFLITAAGILLVADSGRRVAGADGEVNALTVAALALMVAAAVATMLLPRFVAPGMRLVTAWAIGVAPFLYGFAAVMAGSPKVLLAIGAVSSLCLIGWVALSVARNNRSA